MGAPMVVYIIGDNRSGSTLLDYLIASHPDAVSIGEVHHLHGHYYKKGTGKSLDWKCSCGEYVQECKFWSRILVKINFNESFRTKISIPKLKFVKKIKQFFFLKKTLENPNMAEKGKIMATNRWRIYEAVKEQTRKKIIIDSSKSAVEAYYLNKYKKGSIYFLYINRDIHEVALSKKNRMMELNKIYGLKEISIYKIILASYRIRRNINLILNLIKNNSDENNTKEINYLNLTKDPKNEIFHICQFLNIPYFKVPTETNIYNSSLHVLSGSPSRYKRKPIAPDNRWKKFYKDNKKAKFFSDLLQKL